MITEGIILHQDGRREPTREEVILGELTPRETAEPIGQGNFQEKEDVHILEVNKITPRAHMEYDKEDEWPIHMAEIGPMEISEHGKVYMLTIGHEVHKDGRWMSYMGRVFLNDEPMDVVKPTK